MHRRRRRPAPASRWVRSGLVPLLPLVALTLVLVTGTAPATALEPAAAAPAADHPADVTTTTAYAVVDADGAVITYGGADYSGDMLASGLHAPVVAAVAHDGGGYWMDAADGGVFAFGAARFFGSMGGTHLNQPVVGMAATPDGDGYWLVAADGGIFAFGDARFHGSMGGTHLNQPIVGMAATPDGDGYWLVAADGGIFALGNAPFHGSLAGRPPAAPIVSVAATVDGDGYLMAGRDDSVYAFGDAPYRGGASSPLHPPLYPSSASTPIPPAVAILTLPPGPQAAHRGGVRVAFLGDSLGWYEAYYTSNPRPGYLLDNGAVPGCGATDGAPMRMWSAPVRTEPSLPACADWEAQMQWTTQRYHPDAVVIQLGYWEEQTRLWDGRYVNLGDAAYAASIEQNLREAVAIAHADGADVILNTSPYFGDGTPDWIVADFNALVAAVAAEDPSFVSVLDVNRLLSPGGHYTSSIGGVVARAPDNVHLTDAGVRDLIDPVMNPVVEAAGAAVYDGGA